MVFSSLLFLFRFLPIMLIAYFAAPRRFRNGVLFLGSLLFYGWGEPVAVSLLLFSTVVDFYHGKAVGYFLNRGNRGKARGMMISSVVINLGLLGFFKYSGLVPLPIGISFYTFQTMSYTIDVYREKVGVQKNLISFGAYVSMFPQLIAGPIVRYGTIEKELDHRKESVGQFAEGVRIFAIGLGKKVLLANQIGLVWSEIHGMDGGERTVLLAWLGIFAFGMQIYFDFSGYSDMAAGLGRMMGFHFPENFHYPYLADSVTDFWRRWHISLGTWFKEYVYIPLGGNRKGMARQLINILIVWVLTGIWHGAGWNFLLWGLYFGILLMVEKLVLLRYLKRAPAWVGHGYAMIAVFLGWVLFAHDNPEQCILYLTQMAGGQNTRLISGRTLYLLWTSLPLSAAAIMGAGGLPAFWGRRFRTDVREWIFLFAILILTTAYLVNSSYNPFLYFRF